MRKMQDKPSFNVLSTKWPPSASQVVKLNIDASIMGLDEACGGGGLIRDGKGE